jgi:hypothetical protein
VQNIVEHARLNGLLVLGFYVSRSSNHTFPMKSDSKLFDSLWNFRGYSSSVPLIEIIQGPRVSEFRYSATIFSKSYSPERAFVLVDCDIISIASQFYDLKNQLSILKTLTGPISDEKISAVHESLQSRLTPDALTFLISCLKQ